VPILLAKAYALFGIITNYDFLPVRCQDFFQPIVSDKILGKQKAEDNLPLYIYLIYLES
jgi:hypothetical protein